jgi:chromosome segregation ATPase
LIEAAMYFVLGALAAGLLALTITPAIWRRANRLSLARLESAMPMSLAEIQAEKDQLRAEFAINIRRLEVTLGRLGEREAAHVIDMNRKRDEIARLTAEQAGRSEMVRQLEGRVTRLGDEVRATEEKLNDAHGELVERNERIAERGATIASLEAEMVAAMQLGEEQKLELVARDTQLGNFKDEILARRAAESALMHDRDELAAALAQEKIKLSQEQHRGEGLTARITALETERADRIAALDRRVAEIGDREAELALERGRIEVLATEVARLEGERSDRLAELSRYAADIERLKSEVAQAAAERRAREHKFAAERRALEESATADLHALEEQVAVMRESTTEAKAEAMSLMIRAEADLMNSGDNTRKAVTALEAEKAELLERLSALEDEFAVVKAENDELRRVAGADWENERLENSRLRDRLGAIAADVVRLTQPPRGPAVHALEEGNGAGNGNGTTHKPLATPAARPLRTAAEVAAAGEVSPAGKTLAERIRALQHSAARH